MASYGCVWIGWRSCRLSAVLCRNRYRHGGNTLPRQLLLDWIGENIRCCVADAAGCAVGEATATAGAAGGAVVTAGAGDAVATAGAAGDAAVTAGAERAAGGAVATRGAAAGATAATGAGWAACAFASVHPPPSAL